MVRVVILRNLAAWLILNACKLCMRPGLMAVQYEEFVHTSDHVSSAVGPLQNPVRTHMYHQKMPHIFLYHKFWHALMSTWSDQAVTSCFQ